MRNPLRRRPRTVDDIKRDLERARARHAKARREYTKRSTQRFPRVTPENLAPLKAAAEHEEAVVKALADELAEVTGGGAA